MLLPNIFDIVYIVFYYYCYYNHSQFFRKRWIYFRCTYNIFDCLYFRRSYILKKVFLISFKATTVIPFTSTLYIYNIIFQIFDFIGQSKYWILRTGLQWMVNVCRVSSSLITFHSDSESPFVMKGIPGTWNQFQSFNLAHTFQALIYQAKESGTLLFHDLLNVCPA